MISGIVDVIGSRPWRGEKCTIKLSMPLTATFTVVLNIRSALLINVSQDSPTLSLPLSRPKFVD
jgi:hypothetical protein